jgi:hypothetical protein
MRLIKLSDRIFEVMCTTRGLEYLRRRYRHGLESDTRDDTRQTHAAAGRPEQLFMLSGGAPQNRSVANSQIQFQHVRAKRTGTVMALSVNISRNSASNRYELRAGCHRNKPTLRYQEVQKLREQQASLALDDAGMSIKVLQSIQTKCLQRECATQTGVTIGSPVTTGNK